MNNRGANIIIGFYLAYELAALVLFALGKTDLRSVLFATPIAVLGILAQWLSKRSRAKQAQQDVRAL